MKNKLLLLTVIIVNATGLFSGIIEPDGALYAYIAKQMAQQNDFINLYNNTDWLDKPHFPFWVTAFSFKLLGVSSFAYKLPVFLFWLAGIYFLYFLAKELYSKQTAIVAVFIYTTAFQAVVGLFDVRAEHYLTALTIAAIYYLYKLYTAGKIKYLLLAAMFTACAIMTKGIFFLSTIASGLAVVILIKKDWRQFANYKWYLYLLLTFIFILPELYCLYVQFDMHPEKMVFGKNYVSGLRFFFWDSQFGRFFNTGPIKGTGNFFFFFHTVLWAFLPWSVLLYTAIIRLVKERKIITKPLQWIAPAGAAVTFIIFSLSKFQLPHYIIILFPQFAIICADYLVSKKAAKGIRSFTILQRVLLLLAAISVCCLSVVFGLPHYELIIFFTVLTAALFFYFTKEKSLSSVVMLGVGFCILVHLFLNLFFYPVLLQYQSGMAAAQWLNKTIKPAAVGLYKAENTSLKFYADCKIVAIDTLPQLQTNGLPLRYYFISKKDAESLAAKGLSTQVLGSFPHFHTSKLTAGFINKNTRAQYLDTMVIMKINQR